MHGRYSFVLIDWLGAVFARGIVSLNKPVVGSESGGENRGYTRVGAVEEEE